MLRNRLVTVLTLNDGVLFRTKQFVPDYRYTLNFVDAWSVDEIVVLDVTRPGEGRREHFLEMVRELAAKCFVPLACGGGIRSVDDVRELLLAGADKVVLNTGAFDRPELVTETAALYGAQCVVVAIDALRHPGAAPAAQGAGPGGAPAAQDAYEVVVACGSRRTGVPPVQWARRAQELGAGEILVTSVEKDGSLEGYDNTLNRLVADAVTVPVLVCGGAGKWQDFVDGFRDGGASAVCTQNVYHFTETSIHSAKTYLADAGIPVRP